MEELSEDNHDSAVPTNEEVGVLCLNVPDRRPPGVGDFSSVACTPKPAWGHTGCLVLTLGWLLLLYSHLLSTWVSLAACSLLWEFIPPITLGYQP